VIQLVPQLRILVCIRPQDFRRGIDGLASICRAQLGEDPFSGALFVFTNRARTAVKILAYDGSGFWLCHKRFSKGRLRSWPEPGQQALLPMQAHELSVLLYNGAPAVAHFPEPWRPVAAAHGEVARASPTS
jgi:transposase